METNENYCDEYLNINFFNIPDYQETDTGNDPINLTSKQLQTKKTDDKRNNFSDFHKNNINIDFKDNTITKTDNGGNYNNINLNQITQTGFENNFALSEEDILDNYSEDEQSASGILNNFILFPIDFDSHKITKIEDNNLLFNMEDYECPICLHLANNPVMCSECEKLICQCCLSSYKNKNKNINCPNCALPFVEGSISRIVKNTLQNIPIICPNNPVDFFVKHGSINNDANTTKNGLNLENEELKCNEFIIFEQFKQHLENCPLTNRIGSCRYCGEIIHTTNKFVELKEHSKSCKLTNDQCEFCLKLIPKNKFERHLNKCEQNIKQCKNCNAYLTVKEMKNHSIKDCFLEMRGILTNIIKNFNLELNKNYDILDNIHKLFKINEFNVNSMTRKELILSYFEEFDKGEKFDLINDLTLVLSQEIDQLKKESSKFELKIFDSQTNPFGIEDEISKFDNQSTINEAASRIPDNIKSKFLYSLDTAGKTDTERNSLFDFSNDQSFFNPNNLKNVTKNILNEFFSFFVYHESPNQVGDTDKNEKKNENQNLSNNQKINLNSDVDHVDQSAQTIYFLDGTRYEGPIVDGQAEGLGTRYYNYNDWEILYNGCFKNNLFNGLGEIYQNNNLTAKGNFKDGLLNGEGMKMYSNGVTYQGNFKNGKEDGYGKIKFNDKIKYTGDFKNGLKDGVGKYYFSRESPYNFYQGQFKNDVLNGEGTIIYKDGSKYIGNFCNGKKNGKGKCQFTSASYYDGEWKNDRMEGFGIMKYSTGRKYIGNFYNNQWNGDGKEFNKNDKLLFEGIYENGRRKEGKLYEKNDKFQLVKNFKIFEGENKIRIECKKFNITQ